MDIICVCGHPRTDHVSSGLMEWCRNCSCVEFTVPRPDPVERLPDFDGETYSHALDHARLGKQLLRVGRLMGDGHWRTLREISQTTGDPEASVSARLRDLRKHKFGGHTVERERLDRGLFRYRLVLATKARPWDDADA